MLLITTCVITSVHLSISWMPEGAGGILGLAIASSLLNNFSIIGTTLLMLSIWFCFIPIFIGFSWITVIESIGRFIIKLTSLMIEASKKVLLKTKDISRKVEIKKSLKKNAKVKKENDKKTVLSTNLKTEATDKQYTTKPKIEKSKPIIEEGAKAREQRQSKLFESNESSSLPSLEILDEAPNEKYGNSEESLEALSRLLELKLKDFGIDATVEEVLPGPIVTRFEINPAPGVKVNQISNLSKDLARSLSVSSVRIVEVIEGKSYIGIEIPNEKRALVVLGEILRSKTFEDMNSPLTVALGKDIAGNPIVADLQKMPHLLIAGTTGSGKSVGINAMIISLLYKATPKDVRMILIDPKMLELSVYEGIPHLLAPVVTDMRQAANALRWCVVEMERRYRLMSELKVKNLKGFNKKIEDAIRNGEPIQDPLFDVDKQIQLGESTAIPDLETLPNIVVVIDELADMMLTVGKKVEQLITRLAAKARASGIHMIVATQRPSVDVITGIIKANFPARIAFQVATKIDSRTILDVNGADKLIGKGDMLYQKPGSSSPVRMHGAFVTLKEIEDLVEYISKQPKPNEIIIETVRGNTSTLNGNENGIEDELLEQAIEIVVMSKQGSISLLQRRLSVGYSRAARLIDEMERLKIVGPFTGSKAREVLVDESYLKSID